MSKSEVYSGFVGPRCLASGSLEDVVRALYPFRSDPEILVFEHATGAGLDFDWRGTVEDCVNRLNPAPAPATRGRPKLGVVSTEVTLLPRHWEWLARQPGKASATLRRLVEQAMADEGTDPRRRRDALLKILWALAGNRPGFEEAARALTRGEIPEFQRLVQDWPGDLPTWIDRWLNPKEPA